MELQRDLSFTAGFFFFSINNTVQRFLTSLKNGFLSCFLQTLLGAPSYIDEYTQDHQPDYYDKLVLWPVVLYVANNFAIVANIRSEKPKF